MLHRGIYNITVLHDIYDTILYITSHYIVTGVFISRLPLDKLDAAMSRLLSMQGASLD